MNNSTFQQQQQRLSDLRSRRWGCSKGCSVGGSNLELELRSNSIPSTMTATETICETSTSSADSSASTALFEFCRSGKHPPHQACSSWSASPLPASPSQSPHPSPRSPISPMTPRSPLHSPGYQTPASGSPGTRYSAAHQRKRGAAVPGNLARLASRRSSRDSEAGDPSPLQCVRNQQRRTSNFLEIPGIVHHVVDNYN